jgi:hypothetical protein
MAGCHFQTGVDDQIETCEMPHWASESLFATAFGFCAAAAAPVAAGPEG